MASPTIDAQSLTTAQAAPHTSPSRSPKPEVRRLTSNTALAPRGLSPRSSQHLTSARGTLSPAASIPSSPTSIHSSSSAIFERDVEVLLPSSSSPSHHVSAPNPHLVPRGKGTEAIDASVPSVLDSAVEVLASSPSGDIDAFADVSVLAPAPSLLAQSLASVFSTSNPASPVRSRGASPMRSRSPSPLRRLSGAPATASLEQSLLGLSAVGSPPVRPTIETQNTVTQVPRAVSGSANGATDSNSSSPTTTTAERAPTLPTPTPGAAFNIQSRSSGIAIPRPGASSPGQQAATSPSGLTAPPSPNSRGSKRLSFISYADLLQSTPASTVPLAALTSSASSADPPPHLPSVLGLAALQHERGTSTSGASSVHGLSLSSAGSPTGHGHGFGSTSHAARRERESSLLVPGEEAGGEWEREGMGMGLEEKVEVLLGASPQGSPALAGRA